MSTGHGHAHGHGHRHAHGHGHGHGHGRVAWWRAVPAWVRHVLTPHGHDTAGVVDGALEANRRGMRALLISFGALLVTALLQAGLVAVTASVALLGDTLHNVADALTAVPLAIAFLLGRRAVTKRFTYGLGRAEDLAGLVIVLVIAASAALTAWEAAERLARPREVTGLGWLALAGLIGFAGNELVARYRIKVGREIGSAALVGLSQGGALALATAIEHPGRVDRLVALAPAGILSFPPVVHQLLWLTAKLPLLNRTLPGMMLRTREQVAAFARRALFAGPVPDFDEIVDEIVEEVRAGGAGSSDWQNDSIGPFRMRVDLRPHLHEITCPVLLIQGDKDVGVRPGRTRAAAALIPGARFELLEGVGHWSNRQRPDEVNALIAEFLSAGGAGT